MRSLSVGPRILSIKQTYPSGYEDFIRTDLRKCGFHAPLFSYTIGTLSSLNEEKYGALKKLLTCLRGRIDQVWDLPGTIPLRLPNATDLNKMIKLEEFSQNETAVTDIFRRGFNPNSGALTLAELLYVYNQHIKA
jgi:hypothetical protein